MRTLTEKQAFAAMRRYLARHAPLDWDVHELIFATGYRDCTPSRPLTSDPGEWGEWTKCVEVLSEASP